MRKNKKNVILQDVAKKIGVSSMTVSRFLNCPNLVSEETREKIERAISDLNYVQCGLKSENIKICDIANEAGLSPMTVSRAVSKPQLVSEKTRFYIEQTISRMSSRKKESQNSLALSENDFLFMFFCMNLDMALVINYIKNVYERGVIPCVLPYETKTELLSNISRVRCICHCELVVLSDNDDVDFSDLTSIVNVINIAREI
ncbi:MULTISPECIES: LacI family DNA-binding transcriptional regulator [Erwinia]|uniref:LacI family DNA-binding transcriptional regulator n=1 Tax=Erwinia TaxID=551 RepID=UPI00105BD495|nr:LacI family DNA-binding transcriptional regulator [Erwinia aphidicola]MCP2233393.1 transcriptional regulator with XRE-family HTH domain [Erwinia aphidicola]